MTADQKDVTGFPFGAAQVLGSVSEKTFYTKTRTGEILLSLPGIIGVPFMSRHKSFLKTLIAFCSV